MLFQRPTGGTGAYLNISGSHADPERISAYQRPKYLLTGVLRCNIYKCPYLRVPSTKALWLYGILSHYSWLAALQGWKGGDLCKIQMKRRLNSTIRDSKSFFSATVKLEPDVFCQKRCSFFLNLKETLSIIMFWHPSEPSVSAPSSIWSHVTTYCSFVPFWLSIRIIPICATNVLQRQHLRLET